VSWIRVFGASAQWDSDNESNETSNNE